MQEYESNLEKVKRLASEKERQWEETVKAYESKLGSAEESSRKSLLELKLKYKSVKLKAVIRAWRFKHFQLAFKAWSMFTVERKRHASPRDFGKTVPTDGKLAERAATEQDGFGDEVQRRGPPSR